MSSHRKRRTTIGGQFAPRLIEMLESPAYRALSKSAHRILARLEIEMAHHGGKDNGRLPVTFEDFQNYGIDRHAIAPAIRECESLGFVEITEHGRAGNAEFRSPNKFRLTYRDTENTQQPTHDWRRVKTVEDARNLAYEARRRVSKKQNSNGGKRHLSVGKSHPENGTVPVGKAATPAVPEKSTPLSISRVGAHALCQSGSRSAPVGSAVASEPLRETMIDTIVKLHRCSRTEAAIILESLPAAQPPPIE
jgi:hypothetical protein